MAGTQNNQAVGPHQMPWSGTDDEIVVNIAIGSLRESLLAWLKTEKGIHVETLVVAVGSLAEFAAQTAALARVAKRDIPLPPGADKTISPQELSEHLRKAGLLVVATPKTGGRFYFGDLQNSYLVQQKSGDYPLWGFLAAALLNTGAKAADMPDCTEMFRQVAQTVGTSDFGVLRVARERQPHLSPRQALDLLWPRARFILARTDGPGPAKGRNVPVEYWPLVINMVAQQLVVMTKDALDCRTSAALVMESAIVMSKVDPTTVPQEMPAPPSLQ